MQYVGEPHAAPPAVVGDVPENGSSDHEEAGPEEAQEERQHYLVLEDGVEHHFCGNGKRFWLQSELLIGQFVVLAALLAGI